MWGEGGGGGEGEEYNNFTNFHRKLLAIISDYLINNTLVY